MRNKVKRLAGIFLVIYVVLMVFAPIKAKADVGNFAGGGHKHSSSSHSSHSSYRNYNGRDSDEQSSKYENVILILEPVEWN